MNYSNVFAISAAGMTVERTRVDVAALNLANANSVNVIGGANYQPLRVVSRPYFGANIGVSSFLQQFEREVGSVGAKGLGAPRATIEASGEPARMVYEPGHPYASSSGFVSYVGVDSATEMVTLMSALRSYEANVAAMNTARTLAMRALDIGSGT